ncbi:PREDICTED: vacuolar protein sorting-associated protein VTA1 homolog [Rhagoletis zephyria]|uniref:vacuolar protein sorting-associated protein VTA1 homolog n=1 Tax=Rhagoletis zephyria TaxID=28612 RepID=UPI000811700E|nr:PREDICTED: vacuolar protein sorting-associated protein VTA1 homolog [Rhagoletis zephyria]XP_036342342.1 vacuolar protein sorting-associated protein VTA1 homolog [Rhagoletis pomonella]
MEFPPCPPTLKQIQHFLKIAQEHDSRDIVVAYWSRLYALQIGLKISSQQPDESKLLLAIMDWLEGTKKSQLENEAITNEVAAQAHLENYALKLFLYADKQDRESNFGKNVVKAFYSSGVIYDVLQTFGELSEESINNRKYAKWKAAYIHNCLKNGEIPLPGPAADEDGEFGASGGTEANASGDGEGDPDITAIPQDPPADEETAPTSIPDPSPPHSPPPTVDEVLNNPNKLPSPPVDEEKPGGFEPYVPQAQPNRIYIPPTPVADLQLTPEQIMKAQKYTKFAGTALNFDDVKTAIDNLQKALKLLTTGEDE